MRVRRRRQKLAGALALGVAVVGLVGLAASTPASASSTHTAAKTAKTVSKGFPAGDRQVCPTPTSPGVMTCLSVIKTGTRAEVKPELINPFAYEPSDLQKAYNLVAESKDRGKGMTVAIVDGGDDPDAASNLATYRKEWGLPACDKATGAGCLVKVNQNGKASPLPIADPTGSWQVEESLDMDMVSAICPNCRILLVEANFDAANIPDSYNPDVAQFSAAENSAVALGAKFVSNSWGGPDTISDQAFNSAFRHPGVAITVAAGDEGYGVSYPATTQFVTSVGGTSLVPASGKSRDWTESAWSGTGSGCSAIEAKPAWQTVDDTSPDGCLTRTDNDVSAVADPNTGVWIYDTVPFDGQVVDWEPVGGTSAASPIIASVYALAGTPKPGTYPASYLYQKGRVVRDLPRLPVPRRGRLRRPDGPGNPGRHRGLLEHHGGEYDLRHRPGHPGRGHRREAVAGAAGDGLGRQDADVDRAEPAEGPVDQPVWRHLWHPGHDRDRADFKGDSDGGGRERGEGIGVLHHRRGARPGGGIPADDRPGSRGFLQHVPCGHR
jgi:hypothetical protein